MSASKSYTYYLSVPADSDKLVCFRAVFCESCEIKRAFIIASSLFQAVQLLYDELLPVWGKFYLDNCLVDVVFHSTLPLSL